MGLAQEKCAPTKEKMDGREAETLLKELPEWAIEEPRLIRRRSFKNFVEALAYVNRLGELAEKEQHHPDISLGWGYVEIVLTTHDAGGITRNDFIMAAKIDQLG